MTLKKQRFPVKRREAYRDIRKTIFLCCEGIKTESSYFVQLKQMVSNKWQICDESHRKANKSAPTHVLKICKELIKIHLLQKNEKVENDIDRSYYVCAVIDKDSWDIEDIKQLEKIQKQYSNFKFILSNPSFEYWLLLHFEDYKGKISKTTIKRKLENYITKYDKSVPPNILTKENVLLARDRARDKMRSLGLEQPFDNFGTTMWELIDLLFEE